MEGDIPLAALSVEGAELVFALKLHQCPSYAASMPASQIVVACESGQLIASRLVGKKLSQDALRDYHHFQKARETLRHILAEKSNSKLPERIRNEIEKTVFFALLWLTLHDPRRGMMLRQNVIDCFRRGNRAIIQIACSSKIAYAIAVSVNRIDLAGALERADNSTRPHSYVQTKGRIHDVSFDVPPTKH